MITSLALGATASAVPPASPTPATVTASGAAFVPPEGSDTSPDRIRLLLFGTPNAVKSTIALLHQLGYAEPNDWSRPMATGRGREVMAILTKRVGTD